MNSKTNLRTIMNKKTPIHDRINRNLYDSESKYTNKSFTQGKKHSAGKLNMIIGEILSKR